LEKVTDALAAYTTALSLNHAYVSARINLAVLYNRIGKYDESIKEFEKVLEIEAAVDQIIEGRAHVRTFGDRLRAARIAAGMTLKEAAAQIGYTWVGVERWEKNLCLPKPGVLWHLCSVYCVGEDWFKDVVPAGGGSPRQVFTPDLRMGVRGELAALTLRRSHALAATKDNRFHS